jgi:hypothetical protein
LNGLDLAWFYLFMLDLVQLIWFDRIWVSLTWCLVWLDLVWQRKEKKRRCEANDMADSLTCLIVASRYWEYQGRESEPGRKGDKQEKQIGFNGMQSTV